MAHILVLTADLPFFPGKNGIDFFNLRYLARDHVVGVVGPLHPFFPAEGVANLERFLARGYFWPRPAPSVSLPPQENFGGRLASWLRHLKAGWREKLLLRLVGLHDQPADAYLQVAILANCAHQLLAALAEHPWQAVVMIQSNTAPWFRYLPPHLATTVYFHDVRTHFAARQGLVLQSDHEAETTGSQEREVCRKADVVGFVSALDEERARQLLAPRAETGVAPIPVDSDYYTPPPPDWRKDSRAIVLFTGHLSHPPNVDAVVYFLSEIWPLLKARCPDAAFHVAGILPAPALVEACAAAGPSVELHANVPDIRPFFWNASAYVVPMRFGGGVRQKIFESWLMRVPLVCTTMAAEGTLAANAVNCWLADTPEEFALRVSEILISGAPSQVLEAAAGTVMAHNTVEIGGRGFARLMERSLQIKRQRPFKLLYDLRWMEIGKAGGLEQLAYEQLDAISRLDRQNAYRTLCPRSTYSEWRFPAGFQCRGIFWEANEMKRDALHAAVVNDLSAGLKRAPLLNPHLRALRFYKKLDCDLVHSVNSYIHPDLMSFPQVLTMCDLQHIHFPEFFTPEDWKTREDLYRSSSERAQHIICISEHTRQDLHRQYGIALEKITTVWVIPSRAAWIRLEPTRARGLLARMGLKRGRFLFYPAHPWGHKNHLRLFRAFASVADEIPKDIRLVLTGGPFPPSHPAHPLMTDPRLAGRITHLGYRSPIEVRALYGGALGLVFPSLFEGFGMPVAEALIAGCPVACSNTTSLPEIAGDAAITFDPTSEPEIARALLQLANDQPLRSELIAAGERRRPLFSARLSAVKTLAIYRRVFEEFFGDHGTSA